MTFKTGDRVLCINGDFQFRKHPFVDLVAYSMIRRFPKHMEVYTIRRIHKGGENAFKQTLRDYYKYRIGKNDTFNFPENSIMANIIVFLMKLNGHYQINKMLVAKNIHNRQIAFLLYGAYLGFANMPKTFTNIIFDSDNTELFRYIDNYLFNNYINHKL